MSKYSYDSWYQKEYWLGQKTYRTADGKEHVYHGPSLVWEGFDLVADALTKILPKGSLLDVGCGGGDLTRRLQHRGFDTRGVDISEYAIENCAPDMRDRLMLADISQKPHVNGPYDIVIASDFLEHVYAEDIDSVFDWMLDNTKRFMFFCVAVSDGEEFVHTKGVEIPLRWESTCAAGHVHVRRWPYWAKYFLNKGLKIRWDLAYAFQILREKSPAWKGTGGWDLQSTWVLEKIGA